MKVTLEKRFRNLAFPVGLFLITGVLAFFLPSTVHASSWVVYDQSSGLPSQRVVSFAASPRLLAAGTDQGAALYSTETCVWSLVPLPAEIASCEVRDLAFDRNGQLWVATPKGLGHVQEQGIEVYTVADGLPTVDVERLQVVENTLYVGTFGGLVAKTGIPQNGRTSFTPFNYSAAKDAATLMSIDISGMALSKGANGGWISTRGSGLHQFHGASVSPLDKSAGLSSDWVEAFWVFPGPDASEGILAVTAEGISCIKNRQVIANMSLPRLEKCWLTSVVVLPNPEAENTGQVPKNAPDSDDRKLTDFIGQRSLWIGTKKEGLWRFKDGDWTTYTPDNSRLPTRAINRLYVLGERLFACTDQGLVMVSLGSHAYDEFNKTKHGMIGSKNFKSIFPGPEQVPVRHIAIGRSLWASHDMGLARYLGRGRTGEALGNANVDVSGSEEVADKQAIEDGSGRDGGPLVPPKTQIESKIGNFNRDEGSLWSDKITKMHLANGDGLWVIFEEKLLARLIIRRTQGRPTSAGPVVIDEPEWLYVKEDRQPWPQGIKVSGLWMDDGSLFVGTLGDGYYVLENPGDPDTAEKPFKWRHISTLEGLRDLSIIGFARRRLPDGTSQLGLLHPNGLSLFDGKLFSEVDLGGLRAYSCICGDEAGNLWMGSDGGLFRLTGEGKVISYTKTNANFASDRITAVTSVVKTGGGIALWVACDEKAEGSDVTPNTIWVWEDGRRTPPWPLSRGMPESGLLRIEVHESEIDGSSLDYYDGTTWDNWKIPGVLCLAGEDDFLWLGTNVRMRRIRVFN